MIGDLEICTKKRCKPICCVTKQFAQLPALAYNERYVTNADNDKGTQLININSKIFSAITELLIVASTSSCELERNRFYDWRFEVWYPIFHHWDWNQLKKSLSTEYWQKPTLKQTPLPGSWFLKVLYWPTYVPEYYDEQLNNAFIDVQSTMQSHG